MMNVIEKIQSVLTEYRKSIGGYIALIDFVDAPSGFEQFSDVPGIESEWVEQYGDEAAGYPYHGYIYVEVDRGRWAKFEYQT